MSNEKEKPERRRGICRCCGCTDDFACLTLAGPCFWIDDTHTICSGCIGAEE